MLGLVYDFKLDSGPRFCLGTSRTKAFFPVEDKFLIDWAYLFPDKSLGLFRSGIKSHGRLCLQCHLLAHSGTIEAVWLISAPQIQCKIVGF